MPDETTDTSGREQERRPEPPITTRAKTAIAPPAPARRIDYGKVAPDAVAAMRHLEAYVRSCGLEPSLLELVRLRASQLNGCAYCIDMHTKDARSAGEAEQRLYTVAVWEETGFFTARERAALAWTEAVTRLGPDRVSDDVYRLAREQLGERELVDLTIAVIAINGWNRLGVAFRPEPGSYRSAPAAGSAHH